MFNVGTWNRASPVTTWLDPELCRQYFQLQARQNLSGRVGCFRRKGRITPVVTFAEHSLCIIYGSQEINNTPQLNSISVHRNMCWVAEVVFLLLDNEITVLWWLTIFLIQFASMRLQMCRCDWRHALTTRVCAAFGFLHPESGEAADEKLSWAMHNGWERFTLWRKSEDLTPAGQACVRILHAGDKVS